jgi:hypothetical protein
MPRFSIVVEVDRVDDLDSAWLALIAAALEPSLPAVPKRPDRDHGPIYVDVEAETEDAAESRVRDALVVLDADTFSVVPSAF